MPDRLREGSNRGQGAKEERRRRNRFAPSAHSTFLLPVRPVPECLCFSPLPLCRGSDVLPRRRRCAVCAAESGGVRGVAATDTGTQTDRAHQIARGQTRTARVAMTTPPEARSGVGGSTHRVVKAATDGHGPREWRRRRTHPVALSGAALSVLGPLFCARGLPQDDRSYRIITLPNALTALLISDPTTDKSAASLDVNVGSFAEPSEALGLAHFLEHMLFMVRTEEHHAERRV